MKLYSVERSPFAARVRCAAYHKGLDIELAAPPEDGLKGAAFLALNPLGKLPVLVLEDGTVIPESEVIVDYLEQQFPDRPLTPKAPADRARVRLIARVAELYVLGAVFDLFPHLGAGARREAQIEEVFGRLREALGRLEHFVADARLAAGGGVTLADCMALPALFWAGEIHALFGKDAGFEQLPKISAYLSAAQEDPLLGRIWREMADDLAALRADRAG